MAFLLAFPDMLEQRPEQRFRMRYAAHTLPLTQWTEQRQHTENTLAKFPGIWLFEISYDPRDCILGRGRECFGTSLEQGGDTKPAKSQV